MKKFKFRFQTILDIRVRDLEKAELLVAEAQHKVLEAKQTLENLRAEHKKNQTFLKKTLTAGTKIDIQTISNTQNYLVALDKRMENQHIVIKEKEHMLAEIRQEMLLVRQKKLMMDKLKENDFKQYKKDYEMEEMKQLDEMASSRYKK